jgi:preprotein translocase subunit SecG
MTTVLLIVHLFVTIALIGVVLIQRSEGGGLGIGSSQGMGSFMGGRGTANLLTRTTAVLATAFMGLSLALALMNRGTVGAGSSILNVPATSQPAIPGGGASSAPPAAAPGGASSPATRQPAATTSAPPAAGQSPAGQSSTGQSSTGQGPAGQAGAPAALPAPKAPSVPTN